MPSPNSYIITAADVQLETYSWVWGHRIPIGALTMVAGKQGLGKSTMMSRIASDFTNGFGFPDEDDVIEGGKPKGIVLWLTSEESNSLSIVPRLKAAEADESRVFLVDQSVSGPRWARGLMATGHGALFEADLLAIREKFDPETPMLIVMDAIKSFIGANQPDTMIRPYLEYLSAVAKRHSAAIVGLMHMNKSRGDGDAVDAFSGLGEWTQVPRSAIALGKSPALNSENVVGVGIAKTNIARPRPCIDFEIEDASYVDTETGKKVEAGRVRWLGHSTYHLNDYLSKVEVEPLQSSSKLEEAIEKLAESLCYGRRVGNDVYKDLVESTHNGIKTRTLDRAKKELKMKSYREGKITYWELPPIEQLPPHLQEVVRSLTGTEEIDTGEQKP